MKGNSREWWNGAGTAAFPACLTALLVVAVVLLSQHYTSQRGWCFNSDDLTTVGFCDDLLGKGEMSGWHIPFAPYLFPDVALQLPCQLLFSDLSLIFLAYALLFNGALTAVMTWIARQAGLSLRTAYVTASSGVLLLLVTHLGIPYSDRGYLMYHPANHASPVLIGLLLTGLVLRAMQRGYGIGSAAVFVLTGGLTVFSDRLLLAQFMGPMCAVLFLLVLCRIIRFRVFAATVVLVALSMLLSKATGWFVTRQVGLIKLSLANTYQLSTWPEACGILRHLMEGVKHQTIYLLVLVLFFVACGMAVLQGVRIRRLQEKPASVFGEDGGTPREQELAAREETARRRTVALSLALMTMSFSVGNVFAVALMAAKAADAVDRYMLAAVYLPFLFSGLFLQASQWRQIRWCGSILGLLIAGFALVQAGIKLPHLDRGTFHQPYPELAQVVDRLVRERGYRHGLAGYWTARRLSYLTREKARIGAIRKMGDPWFHGCGPGSYMTPGAADPAPPDYHFLIAPSAKHYASLRPAPKIEHIQSEYGNPDEKMIVGPYEVWIYRQPLHSPNLDRFLTGVLARRYRRIGRVVKPSVPKVLGRPKNNLSSSHARGNIRIQPGGSLEVLFPGPIRGRMIDIAAHYQGEYELTFYRGEKALGSLPAPATPWTGEAYFPAGLFCRILSLPDGVAGRAWDRVVIRAGNTPGDYSIGHFLAYEEDLRPAGQTPANSFRPGGFEARSSPASAGPVTRTAPGR